MNAMNDITTITDIGRRIEAARQHLGWTQDRLAEYAQLGGAPVVSSYETGQRIPASENLARLALALNCTADYLLGLDRGALAAHVRLRDRVSARFGMDAARLEWEHRGGVTVLRFGTELVAALFWDRGERCWRLMAADGTLDEDAAVDATCRAVAVVVGRQVRERRGWEQWEWRRGDRMELVLERDVVDKAGGLDTCVGAALGRGSGWKEDWVIDTVETEVEFVQHPSGVAERRPGRRVMVGLLRRPMMTAESWLRKAGLIAGASGDVAAAAGASQVDGTSEAGAPA